MSFVDFEKEIDLSESTRAAELAQIAEGLAHRGVPENLAKETVSLLYRMGHADAMLKQGQLRLVGDCA